VNQSQTLKKNLHNICLINTVCRAWEKHSHNIYTKVHKETPTILVLLGQWIPGLAFINTSHSKILLKLIFQLISTAHNFDFTSIKFQQFKTYFISRIKHGNGIGSQVITLENDHLLNTTPRLMTYSNSLYLNVMLINLVSDLDSSPLTIRLYFHQF